MSTTITCFTALGRPIPCDLHSLLSPDHRETVQAETNQWIKRLRLVRYGQTTMRERFTYRGDSLWWFTELYLHKMRRLERAAAATLALETARDRYAPSRIEITDADDVTGEVAQAFGRAYDVRVEVQKAGGMPSAGWASYLVGLSARLSRWRTAPARRIAKSPAVAAFVHTAFWRTRAATDGPLQEGYIGPVLDAVTRRVGADDLVCVGGRAATELPLAPVVGSCRGISYRGGGHANRATGPSRGAQWRTRDLAPTPRVG
jgi:hypothetical protein